MSQFILFRFLVTTQLALAGLAQLGMTHRDALKKVKAAASKLLVAELDRVAGGPSREESD